MKHVFSFWAGFLSGFAFVFLVALYVNKASVDRGDKGLTVFEQPGEVIPAASFEVFQVLPNGNALAFKGEPKSYGTGYNYLGMAVLFLADEDSHYYDDQIISIPRGKCVRQVGIFQYNTEDDYKTVPVVAIYDR